MSRDKSSRFRRDSRHNNARSNDTTITKEQGSEYSSENEESPDDHQKSTNTRLKKREAATSSSSVKSSRRQSRKLKTSDESENEEQAEGGSTCSKYDDESGSNRKIEIIDSVRKVENFLKSAKIINDKRETESSENNNRLAKREKRRESKKKRRKKSRSLDSNRTEDDDEAYEEDGRTTERDLSRSRIKKSRANVPRKSRRKKRRRSKGTDSLEKKDDNQEKELPITEILRKAQENPRTRYEEPLPLVELTTDRIYVQRRNGFRAVKISGNRGNGIFRGQISREPAPPLYPIKVAIVAQKIWNCTGLIHQGLLAGMALMHLLLMQTFFQMSLDFLENYSLVSEFYTNVFSYLVTMCVISAFDRFDLAQLDIEHLREIYVEHSRSFLAIPLYVAAFCLHQTSLLVNDNISLLGYTRNTTEIENNSSGTVVDEDLTTWRKVSLAKDSLAVLAWLFVALGPREDMLLTHLRAMEKYVETPENCE